MPVDVLVLNDNGLLFWKRFSWTIRKGMKESIQFSESRKERKKYVLRKFNFASGETKLANSLAVSEVEFLSKKMYKSHVIPQQQVQNDW